MYKIRFKIEPLLFLFWGALAISLLMLGVNCLALIRVVAATARSVKPAADVGIVQQQSIMEALDLLGEQVLIIDKVN
ncbi:hypothetical protein A3A66_03625 [Microgenomates group bacterium RIFCSPLOWO2_01_FULL_46_13]|nr:MAG: hypothetical protein A2783_03705 [Microgenomates group bacterium RIFCSPHIGHO2_01_FULL_45_11]OGV95157.1 MAG: hypothetical protein A3A66_03625 [Microgenomates group bacterium RIFCSPLOWO2_01_FULL_46_13]